MQRSLTPAQKQLIRELNDEIWRMEVLIMNTSPENSDPETRDPRDRRLFVQGMMFVRLKLRRFYPGVFSEDEEFFPPIHVGYGVPPEKERERLFVLAEILRRTSPAGLRFDGPLLREVQEMRRMYLTNDDDPRWKKEIPDGGKQGGGDAK